MSRSVPSRQISPLSLWKCRLTAPKIAKIGNFWYKFSPKGYIPLSCFFSPKFGIEKGLPGSHPHAKFYRFGLVNVGLMPKKSPKLLICCIHLPQKGIFPWAIFTKFCLGKKAPGPYCRAKFQRCSFKTMAVRHQKSSKMVIFGTNLPLGKKIMGIDRKTWT